MGSHKELNELFNEMGDELVAQFKGDKGDPGKQGKPGKSIKGDKGDLPSQSLVLEFVRKVFDAFKGDLKGDKGDLGDSVKGDPGKSPIAGIDYDIPTDGDPGDPGEKGAIPDHEWDGKKLRFEKPDGEWGEWINIWDIITQQVKKIKLPKGGILKGFGGVSQSQPVTESITDQCDGSNKVFTTEFNYKAGTLQVSGQDFPYNYDPASDWTETGNNEFTLTSEVDAPKTGQRFLVTYVRS